MPNTEPWTPGEMTRALLSATRTLERIETKLDTRPTRDELGKVESDARAGRREIEANLRAELTRVETAAAAKNKDQDEALESVENRIWAILMAALAAFAAGGSSLVVTLVNR